MIRQTPKPSDRPAQSRREFLSALAAGAVCLGFDGRVSAGRKTASKPELSFGVVADAQYADAEPRMGRLYRQSAEKLADCVKVLNQRKPNFTVHLGDFIDRDFSSFKTIGAIYERLSMPHYHVLGNHDFSVAGPDKPKVPAAMGLDKAGRKKGYYDFVVGRWRFVVVNGTDVSLYADAPESEAHKRARAMVGDLKKRGAKNGVPYNGGLGPEQVGWLARTLAAAEKARQRMILFCHFPVFPVNHHNLYNDATVVDLLGRHGNVAAWINGHNHAGNYGWKNGIHYLTIQGMVQGPTNAYGIVEVHSDHLRLVGFGREPARTMKLR